MSIPFKKYGYTINPITDEIKTPQVFLVNKRLQKVGELYPVENLSIKVNEVNQPDEASFTYHKEKNGEKSPYFNEIDDLSVIQVGDFGFFECSVSKNQNASILKTVTAKSLGYAELSQTLHTLEVNTEDDMKRSDYDMDYPTIFYREIPVGTDEETARKLRESSLFHRILTEAPNYNIGHVDTTLWYVQRTFSWSDTDIVSIFNEVEKEIGCIFDIQVRVSDDGEVERIVNAYDMQYCSHCWEEAKISGEEATSSTSKFRNIVNGVCQNCGESKYIKDIGDDSGIYISTDNLSDDISINGDPDSIKNCLKITGGDDVITATVQGLNMSASGKIMAFSDLQKKAMSPELKEKLDTYNSDYKNNIDDYEALLETEYNMQDIRLYLQSGKMPQIEKEIKTTDEALYSVLSNIEKHFNAKFFISSYNNYYKYPTSSARTSISNMFTTFMPEGFSMTIDKSSSEEDVPGKVFDPNAIYGWYGTVKVYSTGNRDDSYTLHITKSNGTYVTSGTSEEHYISSDASIQSMVDNFRIKFYFADQTQEEYKEYLEQYTAYLLSTVDLTYENEQKKEWDKYGYNLLKSYADGYQKCIETIDDMLSTADGESQKILNETREKYVSIQSDILLQMNVLEDQIFAICRYLGGSYDDSYLNDNGEISYNYKYYKDDKKATIQEIFDHMINPDYVGGYNDDQTVYTPNEYIGDKPFKCLKCNSSNVVISTEGNVCRNNGCGAKGSDIYTYRDMMKNIADSYREHSNSGKTIVELRTDYRNQFDMKTYLGDTLYIELRSFIREDVYNNSNFTSDGLSNAQIIEQAKELKAKAEQELAKACNPQYSVATSISSVVAQKEFVYKGVKVNDDYSKFMINNYVRVLIDEVMYKMRITSIDLKFPITDKIEVTFSNVTNCKTNTAMNVKEILDSAASIATSYDYVATQADKGAVANDQFANIMNEGLNASLMAVKNSRDQDVVIDNHGILLRKKIHETDEYSPYQMKLINRNIVMTDDNWNTAKMAIGLGMYEGVERYGVWADVICGNILCGNKLAIYGGGDGTTGNATVIIDGNGITLDGGAITWTEKLPISSVDGLDDSLLDISEFKNNVASSLGVTTITKDCVISPKIAAEYLYVTKDNYSVEIDPSHSAGDTNTLDGYLIAVRNKNKASDKQVIMGVDTKGKGYFSGEINATSGCIGGETGWRITNLSISNSGSGIIRTVDSSDAKVFSEITSGTIYSQGFDGDTISGSYKYLDIHNGAADFNRVDNSSFKNRTVITSDVIMMYDANGKPWNMFNSYENTIDIGIDPTTSCNFGCSPKFNNGTTIYNGANISGGLRMYISEYDYCQLGATALDSSAMNAYFTVNSSSSIRYRLQVGDEINNLHTDFSFYVKGTSYITGTSYTNSGTTVTSDRNKKNSISTPSDCYINLFDNINLRQFKYNDGTSDRLHLGVIAQELEEAMSNVGISNKDFGGLVIDEQGNYFVRYDEINMLTALKVKQLEERIKVLEDKLNC